MLLLATLRSLKIINASWMTVCKKMGVNLEKSVKTRSYKKVFFTKKICYQGIILNQKNQTDSDDYCHRRFSLKVRFWHFLTNFHSLYSQKQWFHFHSLIFIQKQLLLMTHRQRNSIIQLTLSYILRPRLMRIHLTWTSTSARFEKNPKIFT